jgi:hypothetical protein
MIGQHEGEDAGFDIIDHTHARQQGDAKTSAGGEADGFAAIDMETPLH